jgi:uncharacterized protein (TIRG00374 family)
MNRRVVNGIVIVIILSVVFYLFFVFFTGAEDVLSAFTGIDLAYIPVILAIVFVAYLLRGLRWNYYLHKMGIKVTHREGLWLYFSGLSMLITPMMLSGAIKVGLVKARHGEPISSSFPVVIVERLTDMIGMLVLIVAAGVVLSLFRVDTYFIGVTLFVALFLIGVIAVIRSKRLCLKAISWLGKGRLRKKVKRHFQNAYSTIYRLLTPRAVAVAGSVAFVSWTLQGLALYLVLMGMDMQLGVLETMFIFAFPSVLGIITQLPGGIGAEEGGMLALMLLAGLESGGSVAAILLYRILTLWFGLLMGVVALRYYTSRYLDDETRISGGAAERKNARETEGDPGDN